MFSALLVHILNLFLAVVLLNLAKRGDGCIWYFVTLIIDTTLGITLCYLFHKVIEKVAIKNEIEVIELVILILI
jgi:hypothetical protein